MIFPLALPVMSTYFLVKHPKTQHIYIMKDLLEKKLFPFVIKPGRYTGGEPGQIIKDPVGRVNYLHAYPDKYDIGQSYVGLQTLYHIINSDDRFLCERVFAVDTDAEEIMRREKIELFSLETSRPVKEFDAIGFTLAYELVYTNVLNMLDLAGIPVYAKERGEEHPLVFAGGPAVYNPEPLADFIDLFFIGDAEEGFIEILEILHKHRKEPRHKKLEELVKNVDSVYVPAFYDNDHHPRVSFAQKKIQARLVRELKPNFYPDMPIVPLIDTVHDHLSVEIMRGCPQGCRFCMAGPIYRPVRVRPQSDLLKQIDIQIKNTGYGEVSLMSLSTSDYPDIEQLASSVARRLENKNVAISLPAMRPGTIKPTLLEAASKVRKSGLTIAPETGTERLRQFVRKDFLDDAVYNTARLAFYKGWTTIKLYFMIGLPTETEEDLMGIVDMVKTIYRIGKEYPGRKTINVSLSTFCPKPHTPFQWDEQVAKEEVLKKVYFIKRQNKTNHINIKYTGTEMSLLQGVMGRGHRRLGEVIYSAYRKGCSFDGWSENFKPDLWFEAFREHDIDPEQLLKPIPFDTELPWSHIVKSVSKEQLQKERQRTSTTLKTYVPTKTEEINDITPKPFIEYGRSKKKVAERNASAPTKNRLRLRWGKNEHYKYMSHLDNMRYIERAIRRANLPVAYSQGFNPTMKLSFGPPLPLGITSETELIEIILQTNLTSYMIDNFKKTLVKGICFLEARPVFSKTKSFSSLLNRAIYTLPLESLEKDTEIIDKRIDLILSADNLEVSRTGKTEIKTVDIRPGIFDLHIENDLLEMTVGIGEACYVRPAEVVTAILQSNTDSIHIYNFHRRELFRVDEGGNKINAMDL